MVYDGRKMIDNTAFFSVMAPYMPLRSFPVWRSAEKEKFLLQENSSLLFPYDMTCVSLPFQKMDGRNTFCCRSFPCFPQELPFPGLPQTGMKRPSGQSSAGGGMAGEASQKTFAAALDLRCLLFRPGAIWPVRSGRPGLPLLRKAGEEQEWKTLNRHYHADDHAVGHALDGDGDGRRQSRRS